VHAEGAAVSIQLGHCGLLHPNATLPQRCALGPWFGLNEYGSMSGAPFALAAAARQCRWASMRSSLHSRHCYLPRLRSPEPSPVPENRWLHDRWRWSEVVSLFLGENSLNLTRNSLFTQNNSLFP
jgi:hypothetical protein